MDAKCFQYKKLTLKPEMLTAKNWRQMDKAIQMELFQKIYQFCYDCDKKAFPPICPFDKRERYFSYNNCPEAQIFGVYADKYTSEEIIIGGIRLDRTSPDKIVSASTRLRKS